MKNLIKTLLRPIIANNYSKNKNLVARLQKIYVGSLYTQVFTV